MLRAKAYTTTFTLLPPWLHLDGNDNNDAATSFNPILSHLQPGVPSLLGTLALGYKCASFLRVSLGSASKSCYHHK